MSMTIVKVFSYAWRWIVSPGKAAKDQLEEKQNFWIGFFTVAIFGLLYSITALLLWLTGFLPSFAPILPVSEDNYYFWQTFFTVPWALITWFLAGAAIHLWHSLFSTKSKLADVLGLLGPAFVIPWFFFTWFPETVVAPILGPRAFPPWPDWAEIVRVTVPAFWMGLLFFVAARRVYTANWLLTLGSVLLGAAVFAVMFFTFLR